IVRSEDGQARNFSGDGAAGNGVEALHGDEDREDAMLLRKYARGRDEGVKVVLELALDVVTGLMEIDGAVLAFLVSASGNARDVFGEGCFHGPHEGMNWAKDEDGGLFVPAGVAQRFAAVGIGIRFEGPSRVGAEFGRDAEFTEDGLRLDVTGDDQ